MDATIVAPGNVNLIVSLKIDVQIKCTAAKTLVKEEYIHYPLPVKNYNRLRGKSALPQILIVVIVAKNVGEWATIQESKTILNSCAYWISLAGKKETNNENIASRTV
ncbi:MAG: DUF4365 domain-containing protein [Spirulina sp.]